VPRTEKQHVNSERQMHLITLQQGHQAYVELIPTCSYLFVNDWKYLKTEVQTNQLNKL